MLLEIQQEVMTVTKNSNNPYFKSTYADYLSVQRAIFPELHKRGIIVLQPTTVINGKNYVVTKLVHVETGDSVECETEIIFKSGDAQAQGSGITYARRYGIMSLLALGAEDDDGNQATGRGIQQQQQVQPQQGHLQQQQQQARQQNAQPMILPSQLQKPQPQQPPKPLIEVNNEYWLNAINYCREQGIKAEDLRKWYDISDATCKEMNDRLGFTNSLENMNGYQN